MMRLKFSRRAEIDLENIQDFSVETFGVLVARNYIQELEACCFMLRDQPELGTKFTFESAEYHRFHKARHVIVYKYTKDCVTITRIVHQSQQFES
ncbi:MAG: type II toxin-antitoxin system RelE/ParE family toxin [Pseudomonadota bacterium]